MNHLVKQIEEWYSPYKEKFAEMLAENPEIPESVWEIFVKLLKRGVEPDILVTEEDYLTLYWENYILAEHIKLDILKEEIKATVCRAGTEGFTKMYKITNQIPEELIKIITEYEYRQNQF